MAVQDKEKEWNIKGTVIPKYAVCQIYRMYNGTEQWVDYASIKDFNDAASAHALVELSGGYNGHPYANYRIVYPCPFKQIFPRGGD